MARLRDFVFQAFGILDYISPTRHSITENKSFLFYFLFVLGEKRKT